MTSLVTEQPPVRADAPARRSPAAEFLHTLGHRTMRRLVAAFAPHVGRRRAGRAAGRGPLDSRPEPRWSQLLIGTTTTVMTIVVVDEREARQNAAAVVTRLAELAINDELIVVCGSNERRSGPDTPLVTGGLRTLLPRHDVVALHVAANTGTLRRDAALVGEFLEIGSLPVVVTPTAAAREVAGRLRAELGADRILTVSCTNGGADLYPAAAAVPVAPRPACLVP
ncbi:hypothetical protein [Virgisporangium ochraceum]|uniref:Uncharacterized protein n=1 Tax=Virgisporangium ochraceum TaxID=65505 RepID=A0A8J3ZWW1_9ACTN|nr:hypothetical protein [Virgisporangium ochraceum]GIJ71612.1 hypothetical protein Voc01_065290 [Virgisporangium ochraceum]